MRGLLVASLVFSSFAASGLDQAATETDRDAQLIFELTLGDAKALLAEGRASNDTITIAGKPGALEYRFREHVLSCGTRMTGKVRQTTRDGKTYTDGSFEVSSNPYKIEKLLVKLVSDDATSKVSGVLTVNSKKVDVALVH
jgi:hypothetical protein